MVCHDDILTDLNNMADYHEWLTLIGQIYNLLLID